MKIVSADKVLMEKVDIPGAVNTKIRWLISKDDKAPNFAMRLFEVGKGGQTPLHLHPWEHEVYILDGEGSLVAGEIEYPFKSNDVIFVEPDFQHQFVNKGESTLKFLCLIPHESVYADKKEEPKKEKKTSKNPFAGKKVNNC